MSKKIQATECNAFGCFFVFYIVKSWLTVYNNYIAFERILLNVKRIICVLLMMTLLLTAAVRSVSAAAPYKKMLLLGDSITYGYGLEGQSTSSQLYGNLLRDHLGIKADDCKNAAVNGDTSSDLLTRVTKMTADIKNSDLIVITIGGNDLLGMLWEAANKVLDGKFESTAQILDIMGNEELSKALMSHLTTEKINGVMAKYAANLAAIISFIRSNNDEAEVIFLTQYDPFSGLDGMEQMAELAESAIFMLNDTMRMQTEAGGCTCLDVYMPFLGHAKDWTNMLEFDIHPNVEGHRQIFNVLAKYLDEQALLTTATPETTKAPETTPAATTTVAPETTAVPTAVTTDLDTNVVDDSNGCGATMSVGMTLVISLCGVVICKKKK